MQSKCRRCCGIDAHKNRETVRVLAPVGRPEAGIWRRTFLPFPCDLNQLGAWLKNCKVTEIAVESIDLSVRLLPPPSIPQRSTQSGGSSSGPHDCHRVQRARPPGRTRRTTRRPTAEPSIINAKLGQPDDRAITRTGTGGRPYNCAELHGTSPRPSPRFNPSRRPKPFRRTDRRRANASRCARTAPYTRPAKGADIS